MAAFRILQVGEVDHWRVGVESSQPRHLVCHEVEPDLGPPDGPARCHADGVEQAVVGAGFGKQWDLVDELPAVAKDQGVQFGGMGAMPVDGVGHLDPVAAAQRARDPRDVGQRANAPFEVLVGVLDHLCVQAYPGHHEKAEAFVAGVGA